MLMPNLSLDGHYTVVGRVISGMQYVDAIEKGEPPANPTKITRAAIASDVGAGVPALPAGSQAASVPPETPQERARRERDAKHALEQAVHQAELDKSQEKK